MAPTRRPEVITAAVATLLFAAGAALGLLSWGGAGFATLAVVTGAIVGHLVRPADPPAPPEIPAVPVAAAVPETTDDETSPERPKRERETTAVAWQLRGDTEGKWPLGLQQLLAGIAADERGRVETADSGLSIARFPTPGEALHASRRMVSNVDALRRRVGADLRITVGVHSARGDEAGEVAAQLQAAATELAPVLVSEATARATGPRIKALEEVDRIAIGEREVPVFTFPPVQRKLPFAPPA